MSRHRDLVSVPANTAPKDLPISVIQALGVPVPRERSRTGVLFSMMLDKLKRAGTMAILFDEASHLVDTGSRIQPRPASDWFKSLFDAARVSIVMSGVPRLRRLLESNEQLRGRCRRPLELMPYRWDRAAERKIFAGCAVLAFLKVFESHAFPIQTSMNTDALMRHLYAVSAGNVGLLSNYFKALSREVRAPGPLDLQALKQASEHVNLPAHGLLPPFSRDHMPDERLMQLLMFELATYEISGRKGEDLQMAIATIATMAERSQDKALRAYLMTRVQRLEGLLALRQAASRYLDKRGQFPASLAALVDSGELDAIPSDPLGGGYSISQGTIVANPPRR